MIHFRRLRRAGGACGRIPILPRSGGAGFDLSGESVFVGAVNGCDLYLKEDVEGGFRPVAADDAAEGDVDAVGGVGTSVVAAGVYALGAGALVVAAVSGGLEIAGAFLASEMLYMLSGEAGSWSAVQGLVSLYVC